MNFKETLTIIGKSVKNIVIRIKGIREMRLKRLLRSGGAALLKLSQAKQCRWQLLKLIFPLTNIGELVYVCVGDMIFWLGFVVRNVHINQRLLRRNDTSTLFAAPAANRNQKALDLYVKVPILYLQDLNRTTDNGKPFVFYSPFRQAGVLPTAKDSRLLSGGFQ